MAAAQLLARGWREGVPAKALPTGRRDAEGAPGLIHASHLPAPSSCGARAPRSTLGAGDQSTLPRLPGEPRERRGAGHASSGAQISSWWWPSCGRPEVADAPRPGEQPGGRARRGERRKRGSKRSVFPGASRRRNPADPELSAQGDWAWRAGAHWAGARGAGVSGRRCGTPRAAPSRGLYPAAGTGRGRVALPTAAGSVPAPVHLAGGCPGNPASPPASLATRRTGALPEVTQQRQKGSRDARADHGGIHESPSPAQQIPEAKSGLEEVAAGGAAERTRPRWRCPRSVSHGAVAPASPVAIR